MKILSNEQLRAIDAYTIENEGITGLQLIQRTGKCVADKLLQLCPSTDSRVVVFAGWGRNGADALATCECLLQEGYNPEIILFNIGGNRLSADCAQCRQELLDRFPDCNFTEIIGNFSMPELDANTWVIDGMFGSGLNRPLASSLQMIIRNINESGAKVLSIDIPSGLMGEWNSQTLSRNVIHATLTLTIGTPRLSFFLEDNAEAVGTWESIDIGLSREAIRKSPYTFYLITAKDIKRILRPRDSYASKADYGSALICAGSYGMMGAAVLCTRGCLRSGVGKVTCYAPRCGYYVMQSAVAEAMFERDTHDVALSQITLKHDYQAVAIGPGIGTADITINALENFLKLANANSRSLVLDADALNCIALRPILLNYLPVLSVLTPHAGEFDRLFGPQPSAEARLRKAMEVAAFYNIIIVLKGRYTAIVRPDGKVYINSSGTPALATPGSGDVLTGIITGLIAQGYTPETAATIGVYVHGLAGEICADLHGTYGVCADDVAAATGRAIKMIMQDEV